MTLFKPTAQLKISVTSDCNNNCPICFRKSTRNNNGNSAVLSKNIIFELLEQGADLGFVGAYWTGGEPMLRYDDLLAFITFAQKKGLISSMVTNGGPLGAYGEYEQLNQSLFEESGTYGLSCEAKVRQLHRSGLQRVYFSVDRSHNSLSDREPIVATKVPTDVVAKGLNCFLKAGFGKTHPTQAIGHRLRVTSTASGDEIAPTKIIIEDTMRRCGLQKDEKEAYFGPFGTVQTKRIDTSAIGAAKFLEPRLVDNKSQRSVAGDGGGKYQSNLPKDLRKIQAGVILDPMAKG